MKYWSSWYRSALAGLALLAGLGLHATAAFGQAATPDFLAGGTVTSGGTSANTDITNSASLTYAVSGTNQPVVNSNTSTFKVDKIVNLQVTRINASHVAVAPLALAQVIQFTVTNTGNAIEDFKLDVSNMSNGTAHTIGATPYTDSFDVGTPTACQAFVESTAAASGYTAGVDVDKAISNMSPVTGSNQKTVWVVCDIPNQPSGDAIVALLATAYKATNCTVATGVCVIGNIEAATAGAENPTIVDVVFADSLAASPAVTAGTTTPAIVDANRDGKHSAVGVYRISNATVTVTKAIVTVCDPLNFTTNPKAIPGAFVRYSVRIENWGGALPLPAVSATLTQIADSINTTLLNFDNNFIKGSAADCTTPEGAGNSYRVLCAVAAGSGATNQRAACNTPVTGQLFAQGGVGGPINFASPTITALLAQVLPAVGACAPATNPSAAGIYCAGELKPGENVTIFFNAQIK